jgi:putative transcriptional regulator
MKLCRHQVLLFRDTIVAAGFEMTKDEGLTPAGAEIVEALTEFYETLKQGPDAVAKRYTVRTVEFDLKPRIYTGEEVKRVRDLLGLSQPLFARFLGVSVNAVRAWENGGKKPSDLACRFLDEIALKPDYWRQRVGELIKMRDVSSPSGAERASR